MNSSSTSSITKKILGKDTAKFTVMQEAGFQTQNILNLVSSWPRVPAEYKLHVLADAILNHYKDHPDYSTQLSNLLNTLKAANKDTASYRLGKLISIWLHQRWSALPCAELSSDDAYALFPQHALQAPEIQPPKEPISAGYGGWGSYPSKSLHIPLEWTGATDGFSKVLDHIQEPNRISVIGFGDGNELAVLHRKFPDAKISGFETSPNEKYKTQLDRLSAEPNISIHYDQYRDSFKQDDVPVDLAIIRHPNSLGATQRWYHTVIKTLNSLSPDGTLLMSFYSEKEMRALKNMLVEQGMPDFIWSEKVNPYAYNPSFMSKTGTYSFDFMLAALRPKMSNTPDPLAGLTPDKTRKHEASNVNIKDSLKKFVVVEQGNASIISSPGFYADNHGEAAFADPQNCYHCKTPSHNFYRALTRIGGKYPVYSNVLFCADHVPASTQAWEKKLKEPGSGWADSKPTVYQYFLVGQGIAKPNYDHQAAAVRKIKSSVNGFFASKYVVPAIAVTAGAAIVGAMVYRGL